MTWNPFRPTPSQAGKAMTFGSEALLRALLQFYKERERCG